MADSAGLHINLDILRPKRTGIVFKGFEFPSGLMCGIRFDHFYPSFDCELILANPKLP